MIDTILYDKLDISPGLSDDDIKKVGKKLLLKHHPDKNENKEESSKKFIEVKEILDILTDKEKRELYHKIGISILNNANNINNNPENINNFNNSEFFQNFNAFFNNFTKIRGDFFGGIPGMSIPGMSIPGMSTFNNKNYNSDITYSIKINRNFLREENEYNIFYKRIIVCKECESNPLCKNCNGTKFLQNKIVLNNTIMIQNIPCNLCKNNINICKNCNGNEYTEDNKKVILNIKGDKITELIDNKQTIILRESGNILRDKTTDLIIIFTD